MDEHLKKAITVLKEGGIVIFPTDTAFGIGCRIDNERSIEKLFRIRRRPQTQATPVLAASLHMIEPYLKPIPSEVVTQLITPYWPGALTIVLACLPDKIPRLVRGGTETLGVRIPNHLGTLDLISGVGAPIVGTSANFHGHDTPFQFTQLDPELVRLVDYVVPGECHQKEASTVVDATQKPWKILRRGAVNIAKII